MSNIEKKITTLTFVILFIGFIFPSSTANKPIFATERDSWNEIVYALNSETKAYTSYALFVSEISKLDASLVISEYNTKSLQWKSAFENGLSVYGKYLNNPNENIKLVANNAISCSNKALKAIDQYDILFGGGLSDEEFKSTVKLGDSLMLEASNEHDKVIDLYNERSGYDSQNNTIIVLIISTLISLFFSIILWFKSRLNTPYESDKIKSQIFANLFGNSLWLFGGLVITTGTLYYAQSNGGSYYMMYGPIGIGGWKLLSGLWKYVTQDRRTLNQLKEKDADELLRKTLLSRKK